MVGKKARGARRLGGSAALPVAHLGQGARQDLLVEVGRGGARLLEPGGAGGASGHRTAGLRRPGQERLGELQLGEVVLVVALAHAALVRYLRALAAKAASLLVTVRRETSMVRATSS